jgi:NADP-dependent 3-hydroxy acid dehydrogenase YdfG
MADTAQRTGNGRLEGTVALVTGASSGIGEASALALAGEGAAVAIVARRADRLEALKNTIAESGGTAISIVADMTDEAQARDAVNAAAATLGRLDTVVNNAGLMLLGPIVDADIAEWQRMVHLNLLGLMYVAHAAVPHLLKAAEDSPRQVADLVNISSVAGRTVRKGSGAYNATKHAVGAFSEALRLEVTGRHVRVSLVEPGAVDTELRSHNRPEIQDGMKQRFGDMALLQAEDIADAVSYLVTRARHVAINEILIRPTQQDS